MTFSFAVLAIAFALWRHWPRTVERLRLYEMVRLRGVQLPRDRAAARDVAAAERRCAACASKEMCDESMRADGTRGYRQFCPNALYLEWLHSNSLNFD